MASRPPSDQAALIERLVEEILGESLEDWAEELGLPVSNCDHAS